MPWRRFIRSKRGHGQAITDQISCRLPCRRRQPRRRAGQQEFSETQRRAHAIKAMFGMVYPPFPLLATAGRGLGYCCMQRASKMPSWHETVNDQAAMKKGGAPKKRDLK
jgi:hypothetical protein